ncbi:MAG: hypothetical protein HZC42_07920 [Candidatus Eisenbacteria bacterium]|nr:hypothetical protein [Candidatus Eisenbacteria bacterium]
MKRHPMSMSAVVRWNAVPVAWATALLFLAVAALLATPRPAHSQCAMGGGGGHDHAQRQQSKEKLSGSDRKLQQSIARLLSDERGRTLLADALLADPDFMQAFIAHLVEVPEWRALAADRLSASPPAPAPAAQAALYRCPMHPEVTSDKPGTCPKCGMDLERVKAD